MPSIAFCMRQVPSAWPAKRSVRGTMSAPDPRLEASRPEETFMPIYLYRCQACQARTEVLQKMGAAAPDCPSCGAAALQKMLAPVGIIFKGAGFHKNDYSSKSKSTGSTSPVAKADTPVGAAAASGEKKEPAAAAAASGGDSSSSAKKSASDSAGGAGNKVA